MSCRLNINYTLRISNWTSCGCQWRTCWHIGCYSKQRLQYLHQASILRNSIVSDAMRAFRISLSTSKISSLTCILSSGVTLPVDHVESHSITFNSWGAVCYLVHTTCGYRSIAKHYRHFVQLCAFHIMSYCKCKRLPDACLTHADAWAARTLNNWQVGAMYVPTYHWCMSKHLKDLAA